MNESISRDDDRNFRGVQAPRLPAIAPSRSQTSVALEIDNSNRISAGAPNLAREARALPK